MVSAGFEPLYTEARDKIPYEIIHYSYADKTVTQLEGLSLKLTNFYVRTSRTCIIRKISYR